MDKEQKRQANSAKHRELQKNAIVTLTMEARRPGRPSNYTEALGELVCDRMIEAGSLIKACRDYEDMPDRQRVYAWCVAFPEFDVKFSRARERLMERWSDDILEISEDGTLDPNDRRVRIDTRWKLMETIGRRRFGKNVQVSGDPDNPLMVLHKAVAVEQLSNAQIDALQRFTQSMIEAQDVEIVEENDDQVGGLAPA